MPESFGARLRQRREEQGIALITIADETKIKVSLLEGLERDDVSRWPSGIFRRAYIRAYAHAIGLDPDVVLRDFLEVHGEPSEDLAVAATIALSETHAGSRSSGPPTRLRYIVGSAIESLARLRRTAAAGNPAVAGGAPGRPPGEPALRPPAAAHVSDEPLLTDTADELDAAPSLDAVAPAERGVVAARDQGFDASQAPAPLAEATAAVPASEARAVDVAASSPAPHPPGAPAPVQADDRDAVAAASARDITGRSQGPDFLALARLCADFARAETLNDLRPLVQEAARILDATGLIVWVWDEMAGGLKPAIAHGYSDRVLAQLPPVRRDADNATAAAFRRGETCVIKSRDRTSGALVVPLPTPQESAGVLAVELQHGAEQRTEVHAAATIIAATLAQLAGARRADVPAPPEAVIPPVVTFARPPAAVRKARR
jgi:cytoskeletal protein RodZ